MSKFLIILKLGKTVAKFSSGLILNTKIPILELYYGITVLVLIIITALNNFAGKLIRLKDDRTIYLEIFILFSVNTEPGYINGARG